LGCNKEPEGWIQELIVGQGLALDGTLHFCLSFGSALCQRLSLKSFLSTLQLAELFVRVAPVRKSGIFFFLDLGREGQISAFSKPPVSILDFV